MSKCEHDFSVSRVTDDGEDLGKCMDCPAYEIAEGVWVDCSTTSGTAETRVS